MWYFNKREIFPRNTFSYFISFIKLSVDLKVILFIKFNVIVVEETFNLIIFSYHISLPVLFFIRYVIFFLLNQLI